MAMFASTGNIIVFAYGSNMLMRRINARCPSATPLGMAELRSYELKWHKRSRLDGSGKCDVVQTDNVSHVVYGVLYDIPAREKLELDKAEGLGRGYDEKTVEVAFKGALCSATIYCATDIDASLRPYTWYRALVVAGAKENQLPEKYIEQLADADAITDSNSERHRREIA